MTIEDKAKAYDEALKRAKKWLNAPNVDKIPTYGNRVIEEIFPELKESEDEKIRKGLIDFVKSRIAGFPECKRFTDWLEKQGQDKEINNFDVLPGLYKCVHRMFNGTPDGKLLFEVGNIYKCLSKHDRAEFEVSYGHSVYLEDPVVCKHFIPFENQGRQESTDNVEPKFKKGDWLVHNERKHIIKVVNPTPLVYEVVNILGYHHTITNTAIENNYHLWTIQDAKDGDVLCVKYGNDEMPFIFTGKQDYVAYCALNSFGEFVLSIAEWLLKTTFVLPATKEQRDLLFKKMEEAGYEWDAENKQLKKISQRQLT